MERDEIVKALDRCTNPNGDANCALDCPWGDINACKQNLMYHALTLIKELTEENATLHASCTELTRKCASLCEENERLRAIPEQICEEARQMCFIVGDEEYITLCELYQIAKEMLEGEK